MTKRTRALEKAVRLFAAGVVLLIPKETFAETAYTIAVPGYMDKSTGQDILDKAVTSLICLAQPGDRITVIDGLSLRLLAEGRVPKGTTCDAKVNRMREFVRALRPQLLSDGPRDPQRLNLVNIPGIYSLVGSSKVATADTRLIIVGSLYPPNDQGSGPLFGPGYTLSDGWFNATSLESPQFGTADRRELLTGVTVNFCTIGPRVGETDSRHMGRCWVVHCAALGGVMNSIRSDLALTVQQAAAGGREPHTADKIDPKDLVREVHPIVRDPQPTTPTPSAGGSNDALRTAAAEIPAPRPGHVNVGAVWTSGKGRTDVDLWVTPRPGAEELSFTHRESPDGRYLRDIVYAQNERDSDKWTASWECVEIGSTDPENLTVWLNLYSNDAGEVQGLVRLHTAERIIDVPFTFSGEGNQADQRRGREGQRYWRKIDVRRAIEEASR